MTARGTAEEVAAKRAAVAQLYETHFEKVVRYITVRMGNRDEAEDLASEVFVRALRGVESYKETGAPMEAWLFRIAHNLVVDYLRSRGRRPAPMPLDEDIPLASEHNPGEDLERQEEIRELQQAMERLTPAQRQVLALRFGGDMTSEQVAKLMGKKPGAVRELQSAGIKRLRQILGRPQYASSQHPS